MLRERRAGPLEASREATPSSREPLAEGEQDSESCSATTVSVTPTSVCGRKNPAPHHIVPSPASGLQERERESVSCTVTSRGGSAHTVQSDPLSTSTQLRQREQRLCAGKARVRSGHSSRCSAALYLGRQEDLRDADSPPQQRVSAHSPPPAAHPGHPAELGSVQVGEDQHEGSVFPLWEGGGHRSRPHLTSGPHPLPSTSSSSWCAPRACGGSWGE